MRYLRSVLALHLSTLVACIGRRHVGQGRYVSMKRSCQWPDATLPKDRFNNPHKQTRPEDVGAEHWAGAL